MDIVKDPRFEWLSYKWFFVSVSLLLAIAGGASLLGRGLNLGVDFTGGTIVYVKFNAEPDIERVRKILLAADLDAQGVTQFDAPSKHQLQIRLARVEDEQGSDLSADSRKVFQVLKEEFDPEAASGKPDLNNATTLGLQHCFQNVLEDRPCLAESGKGENLAESSGEELEEHEGGSLAHQVIEYRTELGGLFRDQSDLDKIGLPERLLAALKENFYLGSFSVISVESVGPKVGEELKYKARSAVFFSLLGIVAYIWVRFRGIAYGLAAVVALFHDVFITLGFFSIFGQEISLTVIAALLTLVGYSINDTIVVFDRVRENLRLMRRADFGTVINASINQTLNRTILTSGMTFLAVLALYLMGGQALNAFSFALVVGILVGTYSSVAIASPIVHWWVGLRQRG